MRRKKDTAACQQLKKNLSEINQDWDLLLKKTGSEKDVKFLKKIASDIKQLNEDAHHAEHIASLKEQVKLIMHLLSTPWGAPFVGETTLIDAAQTFSEKDYRNTALFHLISDFSKYGHKYENQIFQVFDVLEKGME